jgi:hypothetical protein
MYLILSVSRWIGVLIKIYVNVAYREDEKKIRISRMWSHYGE